MFVLKLSGKQKFGYSRVERKNFFPVFLFKIVLDFYGDCFFFLLSIFVLIALRIVIALPTIAKAIFVACFQY